MQYVSIEYTERLAEAGIEPSVGSVGDSYVARIRESERLAVETADLGVGLGTYSACPPAGCTGSMADCRA